MVENDLNNLADGVYFFVDRDYDEFDDHPPSERLFVTETYSIENFLVRPETVSELLKSHFHCIPEVLERGKIVEIFEKVYQDFLDATREINFRGFVAKRMRLNVIPSLPNKLKKLAIVELDKVEPVAEHAADIIKFDMEPSEGQLSELRRVFDLLKAKRDYRGKYAVLFFMRWLDHLVRDRNAEDSLLFSRIKTAESVEQIYLDCIASRSVVPPTLYDFVGNMRPVVL